MNVLEDNPDLVVKNNNPANQRDEYVRCPYFPEHELRRNRLPYHLIKCQNNPNAPKLVACPYNYLHRVRLEDRREHLLLCEDRVSNKYSDRDLPSYEKTRKQIYGPNSAPEKAQLEEEIEEW